MKNQYLLSAPGEEPRRGGRIGVSGEATTGGDLEDSEAELYNDDDGDDEYCDRAERQSP